MTRMIMRITGAALGLASIAAVITDFSRISAAEIILCAAALIAGAVLFVIASKPAAHPPEPPKPDALFEENEQLRKRLAESSAALDGLRGYIAELLPHQGGSFRESYVLLGMEFTPKQLMDKLNELTEAELAERGLDFSIDISPSLPERLCGDMPRLSLAVCGMISAAAARMESGLISLEILSAGGERMELRVSDTGRQLSRGTLEAAIMGQFPEDYSYAARTAEIMHGELRLRNTSKGVSASLTVLVNFVAAESDARRNIGV
ncbi:MAG: hypothetical protein ACI4KM_05740 [Oscillospiraceae bacterium]